MAAFGTILLAIVTFLIHILGDSYTRLIKKKCELKFLDEAYNFLYQTLCSWDNQSIVPIPNKQITVEENIDGFYKKLIKNNLYLLYWNRRKIKKYIDLARKHASSWNNPVELSEKLPKIRDKIFCEMEQLSKKIGKESEFKKFYEQCLKNQRSKN